MDSEKKKAFHVDVLVTEEAYVRCFADNEDHAKELALQYLAGKTVAASVKSVKEIDDILEGTEEGFELDAGIPVYN